jgi:hypothetical protein
VSRPHSLNTSRSSFRLTDLYCMDDRLFLVFAAYMALKSQNLVQIIAVVLFNIYLVISGRTSLVTDMSCAPEPDISVAIQSSRSRSARMCSAKRSRNARGRPHTRGRSSQSCGRYRLWMHCKSRTSTSPRVASPRGQTAARRDRFHFAVDWAAWKLYKELGCQSCIALLSMSL